MTADAGRNTALTWNGSSILGVRTKGLKASGTPIDITTGEDAGKRLLLAAYTAQDSLDITLAGVSKDPTLRNAWFAGGSNRQKTVVMTRPDGSTISGTFHLSDYQDDDPYNEASTFSATLLSSGTWSYTPGT